MVAERAYSATNASINHSDKPSQRGQRQQEHQRRPPNSQPPAAGECGFVVFLRAIDVAGGVAIVLDQGDRAAKGFRRRFGEHFVLGALPGEELPGRAAFGRRAFDQAAADRGALGLEPDGAAGGVEHAFLHVAGRAHGIFVPSTATSSRKRL